jgi:hypothetical protein
MKKMDVKKLSGKEKDGLEILNIALARSCCEGLEQINENEEEAVVFSEAYLQTMEDILQKMERPCAWRRKSMLHTMMNLTFQRATGFLFFTVVFLGIALGLLM